MNGNAAAAAAAKRKSRPNIARAPRGKGSMDRANTVDGVYSNPRFTHAAASLLGCIIQVHTVEGSVYEGIFRTFSPQCECVLEMAHKVDNNMQKLGQICMPAKDEIIQKLILKTSDIEMLTTLNADLEYATKDVFATDTAISKYNGQLAEKELEPWDGAPGECEEFSTLDSENANGWDVNDMFRTNEQQYGVQSTYDHTLAGYTMQLEKKNTDEYKKNEAKALKIASEIESSATYRIRVATENTDEDEKISAVVRPNDNANCSGKYVPPGKRKTQPGGKPIRSTPSPQGSYGGPPSGMGRPVHGMTHPPHVSMPPQSSHVMHPNNGGLVGGLPPSAHMNMGPARSPHAPSHHALPPLPHAQPPPQQQQQQNQQPPKPLAQIAEGEAKLNGSREEHKKPPVEGPIGAENDVKPQPLEQAKLVTSELSNSGPPVQAAQPHQIASSNHIQSKVSRKIITPKAAREEETADLKKFKSNFKLSEEVKDDASKVEEADLKEKLDDVEKMTNTLKKSTLNPNAKEFVLNPNAKSFTPRSPSTQIPTPPRQHTPGTIMTQPPSMPVVHNQHHNQHIFAPLAPQYIMSTPINVSLAASSMNAAAMQQGPRFRKTNPGSMQQRPEFSPSMHVAAATGQPILASTGMATPSFVQYAPQAMVPSHSNQQHSMPYTQMYSMVTSRIMPGQGMAMVPSHLVTHHDTQHVPSQMFVSAHPGVPQQLPPGSTPPHPAQSMTPGGPHPSQQPQGQQQQQSQQQGPMGGQGQVTGMHPTPSPVHGGNPPNQGNHQPPSNPNTLQLTAYPGMQQAAANMQQQAGNPHASNSPQTMHQSVTPSSMAQSNPHFHPGSIVTHAGAGPHAAHSSQAQAQAAAAAAAAAYQGHQQMVILHPQGPGTPTQLGSHPQGMPTHTLQGHPIHGHGAPSQMAHLVPHTSMALAPVIQATSASVQAAAQHHQHQIFIQHHSVPYNMYSG